MKTETTIVERIRKIIHYENISVESFSKLTGISKYTLDSMFKKETNPSFDNLNKIINSCPQYSLEWLMTGKGNMLRPRPYGDADGESMYVSAPEESYFALRNGLHYAEMPNGKFRIRVPLVSVKAYPAYIENSANADVLSGLDTAEFIVDKIDAEHYIAFEVKGDSMDDGSKRSICDRDIVLSCEKESNSLNVNIKNSNYPFWMLVLDNAIICKEITAYNAARDEISCRSLNPSPEYADFLLPLNQVRQLCNIIAKQSSCF
ncbi:MAG: helix-turn-helix domain-containing protein [Prevotella sp.]|jgi:transcriptional regulator with XRE-family HTH domain|nr:helix-turn-helix domain-containing protein [Prevotella sp.]